MNVTKYLITCQTCFCGCDEEYGIEHEDLLEVENITQQLAHDNFYYTHGCANDALSDDGYDLDEMSEEEYDDACIKMDEDGGYWWSTVEEFTGTEEEWQHLQKV